MNFIDLPREILELMMIDMLSDLDVIKLVTLNKTLYEIYTNMMSNSYLRNLYIEKHLTYTPSDTEIGCKFRNKKYGPWKYLYKDGKIYLEGQYEEDKRIGYWKGFHANGNVLFEGYYMNGKQNGRWTEFDIYGHIRYERHYSNGIQTGCWKEFDINGELCREKYYMNGKQIEERYYLHGNRVCWTLFYYGISAAKKNKRS